MRDFFNLGQSEWFRRAFFISRSRRDAYDAVRLTLNLNSHRSQTGQHTLYRLTAIQIHRRPALESPTRRQAVVETLRRRRALPFCR
jgi:hypothetical protein